MRKSTLVIVSVCCLSVLLGAACLAAYEPVYLGTLGGAESWALGVNGQGAVVGCSIDKDGRHRAFLWTEAKGMIDLGTLGGENAVAAAINDEGEIVGTSDTETGARRAFIRTVEEGLDDLGVILDDVSSEAASVSDFVVGWSTSDSGVDHAFAWSVDGGLLRLAELSPAGSTRAFDVNRQGFAVGAAKDANGNLRAVLWRADGTLSMHDTGILGGSQSSAFGVNRAGLVVGEANDESGQFHAFCWVPATGMHRLPSVPRATGARANSINNANQIAGTALGAQQRPVVWDIGSELSETMSAKIALLPLLRGAVAGDAVAINDAGVVVGHCVTKDGKKQAVLWRPVKDQRPRSSIALMGGVFFPVDSETRDRFSKTWVRADLVPFQREKRTSTHFTIESGAYRFNGPTSVRLYEVSAGLEKGLPQRGSVQPYLALRAGPYWGRMTESETGIRERNTGLNLNASCGFIFNRNLYTELRFDYFSKFAGVDFSGVSLTLGFRLFDLGRAR